jgi:hypothetical protein
MNYTYLQYSSFKSGFAMVGLREKGSNEIRTASGNGK